MKCKTTETRWGRRYDGLCAFTLIEVLVVMAIISVLLAILLPCLQQARNRAMKLACQSNLREISLAWHMYLLDNDDKFFRGMNADRYFGGGKTLSAGERVRPLNQYLNLPPVDASLNDAKVFHCPADSGVEAYPVPVFLRFGNSYRANTLLIGPIQQDRGNEINQLLNPSLKTLRGSDITQPKRTILVGDDNWGPQWYPLWPRHAKEWHPGKHTHNIGFMDSHVESVKIIKGLYVQPGGYRVSPFARLDRDVLSLQEPVPCECEQNP